MKEQAELYSSSGEGGLRDKLQPKPKLYDDLLEAARTLPLKPTLETSGGKLIGARVELRPIDRESNNDFEALHQASNGSAALGHAHDASTAIWAHMPQGPFSDAEVFRAAFAEEAPHALTLVVRDKVEGKSIGMVALTSNSPTNLRACLGDMWLNPTYHTRERELYGLEVVYLLLQHLFELGYRRVEWQVDALDNRAKALAEGAGMVLEGVLRKHMVVKERNRDTALFAVVNSDWKCGGKDKLGGKLGLLAMVGADQKGKSKSM
ncbi:unnamed protein product [Chrysoparadoxa australica]